MRETYKLTNHFRIGKLITLHLTGNLDQEQQTDLDEWINSNEYNAYIFNKITSQTSLAAALQELENMDIENALLNVKGRITAESTLSHVQKPIRGLPRFVGIAAAILIILSTGLYFFSTTPVTLNLFQSLNAKHNDFAPGGNKAFLTLANGKVINLSDTKTGVVIDAGKLTYSDGSEVRVSSKTESLGPQSRQSLRGFSGDPLTSADGQPLTIQTPRGGTYQVILSDSTHVYLNAASSIKFPASFAHLKERKVELTGEAYFVVKHNAAQPFKVQTAGQIVEDIGTEFNINSYADESSIKTTLIEGSARVVPILAVSPPRHPEPNPEFSSGSGTRTNNDIILKPNQQSILTNGAIKVTQANIEEAIAWKNGYFMFNNENLENIMKKVSRWYNVSVDFENNSLKEKIFSGTISRFKNVSQVIDKLELTGSVHFEVEERRIAVMK